MIMAEAEDKRLHNFFIFSENKRKFDELSRKEETDEIELSLGLSLNGRFGFDPNRSLARSSSVSNFNFTVASVEVEPAAEGLGRTLSMPAATEEEWRRMKELQSARRMEAKRRRVEKMKAARDSEVDNGRIRERHVSIGSQGSGSSGVSEAEPQHANQVANIQIKARSPGSVQSPSNQIKPKEANLTAGKKTEIPSSNHNPMEMMKNMMVDMPCVSTRGVGPSGKKVEGFLYRYRKGEEVRIVCVCHGSFLSPAEFVKHAGGGDVAQPLKHIVVNPSPLI